MTDISERPIDGNGHVPDDTDRNVVWGSGVGAPRPPAHPDVAITAGDITAQYRDYTHKFIDELFDTASDEDIGFGKNSGVVGYFADAITPETYVERLTAMIIRWADMIYSMAEDWCDGPESCRVGSWCPSHELPDLNQPFPVAPALQRIFDEIQCRGVWRYLGIGGLTLAYPRYLNVLTGEIKHVRPYAFKDTADNDLRTREGGL